MQLKHHTPVDLNGGFFGDPLVSNLPKAWRCLSGWNRDLGDAVLERGFDDVEGFLWFMISSIIAPPEGRDGITSLVGPANGEEPLRRKLRTTPGGPLGGLHILSERYCGLRTSQLRYFSETKVGRNNGTAYIMYLVSFMTI